MMQKINVPLKENSYIIKIGSNILGDFSKTINLSEIDKCLLFIDKNVFNLHKDFIRRFSASINVKPIHLIYNAGERNKSLNSVLPVYKELHKNNFTRNSAIISIGGGITGDVAAFAASTFKRGLKLFQIPTTLLSMVDSSVGGKTGVNFNNTKNIIGTFYQPDEVIIDTSFLLTLSKKEMLSGVGEIFKYAFLTDTKNYVYLNKKIKKVIDERGFDLSTTIKKCLKIKVDIVLHDEKEISGVRKILNLGHTFAHSFESETKYKITHGEAVIGGIYSALFLSEKLGYLSTHLLERFISDFQFLKPSKILRSVNSGRVISTMLLDKKNSGGKVNFVLIEDIGNVIVDVNTNDSNIYYAINRMKELI